MDWNLNATSQWDWENLAMYTTKEIAVPKNLQFSSHETQENVGNFSFSASENSKETIGVFDDLAKELLEKEDQSSSWICENNGSFSNMAEEASVLSGEAMIGLKLGRHASSSSSSNNNNKVPLFPPMIKRSRASYLSSQSQRCQVEGCNLDLSSAKDYHRRHRICANHSKSPKVVVSGMERRFCQQCSRFHDLSEFDDRKRSCRRRLSAHNARRRRPHSEEIQFTSTRLSSSISDRRPQMNFLLNRASLPILDSTPAESSCNFKGGGNHDLLRTSGLHFDSERFMPRNMNHNGIEATPNSILSGNVRHAFSLLSTSSWPSNWPEESSSFDQFSQANLSQPGMPLALQNTSGTNQLQNFHSFRSPQEYERFYSN